MSRFNYAHRREAAAERQRLRHVKSVLKEYEQLGEDPHYAGAQPISPALLATVKGPPRTAPPAIPPRPAAKPKIQPAASSGIVADGHAMTALQKLGALIRKGE